MHSYRLRKTGFTLIELLVVIAIIAILAAILFPVFARARDAARKTTCTSNLKQITLGQLMYLQDYDERFSFWDPGTGQPMDSWGLPWGSGWWMNQIQPYIKNTGLYECPNDTRAVGDQRGWGYAVIPNSSPVRYYVSSYGVNEHAVSVALNQSKLPTWPYPAQSVLYTDAVGPLIHDWDDCGAYPPVGPTRTWYANAGAWTPSPHRDYERWKIYVRHQEGEVVSFIDGHVKYMPCKSWGMQTPNGNYCPGDGVVKKQRPIYTPGFEPL